ncbi:autoinducer 2 sensor kinase/phosphatase LuxQ [mine drainage metagenome]|uniref:Autoinducer 2 sensor kinase/phosphatase LuxQ n=1 Tax=mine drainage metagenome TaxID=410659 RepID=A0A1J5SU83_9ZZZZ
MYRGIVKNKIFFLISCLLFLGCQELKNTEELPRATKGVLDLRKIDLQKTTVTFGGEWGFYWKKILHPSSDFSNPQYVEFEKLWNNMTVNNVKLSSYGFATYTLTVLMPKQKENLALQIPDMYSCYRLYINNIEVSANGNPDSIKEKSTPKWINETIQLINPTDTLHIVLQIANYWHSKGGPYKEILMGSKDKLFYEKEKESAFDLLLTGCLFMGGLFFFGLFLFGKHDMVILYFSLFCIAYSYRIMGTGIYEFHSIFPNIPWIITIRLEYISLFSSIAFFSLYTRRLYPKDFHFIAARIMVILCTTYIFITLIFPPRIFTLLIGPFLATMFLFIFYALYVYINAAKNKRVGAGYALLSTAAGLIICLIIDLEYFHIVEPQKGWLFIGYVTFFFLQSLILSFRFAYTLNKAKTEAEQGLRAKSEFLSTMSHEIRTPLNSVIGISHLLLRTNPREDQKENMNVLLFSANNLLSIVNDILDYNKIEAGKIKFEQVEMDIVSISRNIVSGLKSFADDKHIELIFKTDPALHTKIIGDPTRTSQIINNLVHNAIKFTKEGSVLVELIVEAQTENAITVKIRIKDTGIGIEEEKQKIIFEQFTQADSSTSRGFGGTGLGLAISKKLLELQDSQLQLISEPGKGSEFYFVQTFPISKTATPEINSVIDLPDEETKPLTNIDLLLVEDNEMNILVAQTFLERWGAKIDIARNGEEGVRMLDVNRHKLILMDMHMPIMDGYEATKKIREKGITIPIIALTASLPKEVEAQTKEKGMDDIVVKPFNPDELYRKILHYTNVYRSL